ncbi:hypothetical protein, partial [Streptococcus suis]|uniref:hypothetical protein n=1 Tax=Streptococcus suis TaxID=1307 RepID=UPI0019606A5D
AKKLAQKSRNRKKNTGSSAGFHQKQLNLSVFFIYWLVFAQPPFFFRKNSGHFLRRITGSVLK